MTTSRVSILALLAITALHASAFVVQDTPRASIALVNTGPQNVTAHIVGKTITLGGSIIRLGQYVATVTIGGMSFTVQVDSGSATLAVPDSSCTTCNFGGLPGYAPTSGYAMTPCNGGGCTSCYTGTSGCQFSITYGDGSHIGGPLGKDSINIGGLSTTTGSFGRMYTASGGFSNAGASVGILGVGYSNLNCNPSCQPTVLDRMVADTGMAYVFGMCLNPSGGVWDLGYADLNKAQGGVINYVPVSKKGWYQVALGTTTIPGTSLSYNGASDTTIIDSGTTLMMISNNMYNAIVTALTALNLPGGSKILDPSTTCASISATQAASWPAIKMTFANGVTVSVPATSYLLAYFTNTYCFGISSTGSAFNILGDVFMQSMYIVFDQQNNRVGFAPLAPGSCSASIAINPAGGSGTTTGSGSSSTAPTTSYTYSWVTGAWSTCSSSCTQTRTLTCQRSDSTVASSTSLCTDSAPATSQSCTGGSCPSFSWNTGSWGACSVSCGSGVQTRSVSCMGSNGVIASSTTSCPGTAPLFYQTCTGSSCVSYSWTMGGWGACSATSCGTSGTQVRTTTCTGSDGKTYAASMCSGSAPTTSQNCQSSATCITYSWQTGNYGSCSSTCGSGTQARSVSCVGSDGKAYDTSMCSGTAPTASQSCSAGVTCPTYSWSLGSWSSCSATCGAGTQTRAVQCINSATAGGVTSSYCSGSAPVSSQSCTLGSCPSYSWSTGTPSACSASCGTGTQTRSVSCMSSTGVAAAATSCASPAPWSSQSCTGTSCTSVASTGGSWVTGAWGGCIVNCPGGGVQSRVVVCVSATGSVLANSVCAATATMPASTATCASTSCNVAVTYSWVPSPWSACSASCGYSTQTRGMSCVNSLNAVVAASNCAALSTPATTATCVKPACTSSTSSYSWWISGWGGCSANCNGGLQYRVAYCQDKSGNFVAASQCTSAGLTQPSTSQSCNTQKCTVNNVISACHGNTCSGRGTCVVDNTGAAACNCTGDYSGNFCELEPQLSGVEVIQSDETQYIVSWQYSGTSGSVNLYLVNSNNVAITLASNQDNTGSLVLDASAVEKAAGQYYIEVAASAVARGRADPFYILTNNTLSVPVPTPSPTPQLSNTYLEVTVGPFMVQSSKITASSFKQQLINELGAALNINPKRIFVQALKDQDTGLFATLKIYATIGGAAAATAKPLTSLSIHTIHDEAPAEDPLYSLGALLRTSVANPISSVYDGAVGSRLDYSRVTVSYSEQVDDSSSGSSGSSSSNTALIGGSVAGCVALAALVAFAVVRARKQGATSTTPGDEKPRMSPVPEDMGADVEEGARAAHARGRRDSIRRRSIANDAIIAQMQA